MKKILAMICVFALVLSMTAFGVSARQDLYFGDLMYEIRDDVAVITGIKEYHLSGDIVIPATIDENGVEYPVRAIDYLAFSDVSDIYSVEIPDSVMKIGGGAFCNCDGLESIIIPDSVTEIITEVYGAFENCDNLKSVVIGNGLRVIPKSLFESCDSLQEVALGEKVTTVGGRAFAACSNLTKIDLKNATKVEERAFEGCTALTELIIPQSNTIIEAGAFWNCDSLAQLDLSNVCTIGRSAFYGCDSLVEVMIPESVSQIVDPYYHDGAFENCYALKNMVIMGSMSSIPMDTFSNNINLKNVFIDKGNLNTIHNSAFDGSNNIENVYFSGTEAEWIAISGDNAFGEDVNIIFNATYDEHMFDEVIEPTEPETTVPAVEDKGLLGDVNDDEKVNIKDATEIQKYAAKMTDLDADAQIRADVNVDNRINVKDATAIQKYAAKIDTGLDIGKAIV